MPFIDLKLSGPENPVLAQSLVREMGRLTKDLLNKKPELTAVTVSFVPEHLWFINAVSLTDLKSRSFHLEIKITDSTNVKAEKGKYIAAVHHALSTFLEPIHPVSYTAIHEMKADAYGYEGQTIEYKYINQTK